MALNIKALLQADRYDHPVNHFQVIETHISWVLLTGDFAYKIKKPVNLGFVDYSSLKKRKFYCEEEFHLNQILAKNIVLAVVPIYGTLEDPSFKPHNPHKPHQKKTINQTEMMEDDIIENNIIEYAVKMRQFDQSMMLNQLLEKNELTQNILVNIAVQVAAFHENAEPAAINTPFGSAENIKEPLLDNFLDCETLLKEWEENKDPILDLREILKDLKALKTWSLTVFQQKLSLFEARKRNGFVRDCHGDLHLGNMVLLNSKTTIFDRIEFNLNFRWNDIINEVAFLMMDLEERHHTELAYSFLNPYLQQIGDYEGLELLDFYKIYRAMVRAKVALESPINNKLSVFHHYLHYGLSIALKNQEDKNQKAKNQKPPKLIITVGVSGSGKTFLSNELAPYIPAIHIRSDIERKRLFFADRLPSLYVAEKTEATYERLYEISNSLLQWGYSVLVDATFLQKKHREKFQKLAEKLKVPFSILQVNAPKTVLAERIRERLSNRQDASEATLEVLEMQLKNEEPLTEEELQSTKTVFNEESHDKKFDIQTIIASLDDLNSNF